MLRNVLVRRSCILQHQVSRQWSRSFAGLPTQDHDSTTDQLEANETESRPPPLTEEARKQLESIWSEYNQSYQHQRSKGWKT